MAKAFLTMLEYLADEPFNQQFCKQIKMSRNQLHMLYVTKGLVGLLNFYLMLNAVCSFFLFLVGRVSFRGELSFLKSS